MSYLVLGLLFGGAAAAYITRGNRKKQIMWFVLTFLLWWIIVPVAPFVWFLKALSNRRNSVLAKTSQRSFAQQAARVSYLNTVTSLTETYNNIYAFQQDSNFLAQCGFNVKSKMQGDRITDRESNSSTKRNNHGWSARGKHVGYHTSKGKSSRNSSGHTTTHSDLLVIYEKDSSIVNIELLDIHPDTGEKGCFITCERRV